MLCWHSSCASSPFILNRSGGFWCSEKNDSGRLNIMTDICLIRCTFFFYSNKNNTCESHYSSSNSDKLWSSCLVRDRFWRKSTHHQKSCLEMCFMICLTWTATMCNCYFTDIFHIYIYIYIIHIMWFWWYKLMYLSWFCDINTAILDVTNLGYHCI